MLFVTSQCSSKFLFTVPLGSIPELPGKSCKEIKASEKGQAVSDKYWFDTIKPGVSVLANCDMESEGEFSYKTHLSCY